MTEWHFANGQQTVGSLGSRIPKKTTRGTYVQIERREFRQAEGKGEWLVRVGGWRIVMWPAGNYLAPWTSLIKMKLFYPEIFKCFHPIDLFTEKRLRSLLIVLASAIAIELVPIEATDDASSREQLPASEPLWPGAPVIALTNQNEFETFPEFPQPIDNETSSAMDETMSIATNASDDDQQFVVLDTPEDDVFNNAGNPFELI
ncbi:unnamed protein product [Toxocara canis]|uniref:Uncharacterized protein n=1 Tax=Toxocara canis TaxID=6265 RepID=A0A183TV45_TOXCA|nr:unnamed protein product [Toxocara canis]